MKIFGSALAFSLSLTLASHAHAEQTEFPTEAASPPDASAKQEAARRFEHAIKLYEEADYTLALAEFERVYQLVPDYRVLYNIGQVNIQLGRYARAQRALREYVERGGAELPNDRRAAVQADLNSLDSRTARIAVEVEPAGAEIWVGPNLVGKSPLVQPLVVDVGERVVQVKLAGYATQTRTLTLAGGDIREERFELKPEQSAPVATPAPAPALPSRLTAPPVLAPVREQPRTSYTWVGWSATSALAVSAGVFAALGASSASELADLRTTPNASRTDLNDARDSTKTRLLVADVLGAAALATGAVTLYFQLSKPSAHERPRSALSLGVAPSGVAVRLAH
jgi:hypothetical protein